ncbi:MAG: hypothetical protein QGH20_07645 [Candidatus Latescibacteria bacterium]|nr:hypothetical protein [Candidatus Latescibacterota bacterium]
MKRWAPNLGLAVVSAVLALLLAEGILRWLDPDAENYRSFLSETHVQDSEIGFIPRPHTSAILNRMPEFSHELRYNSFGMRDEKYSIARPPGVIRMLVAGDSFVLGSGVVRDSCFVERLERSVQPDTQLIYIGVATRQELLWHNRVGAQFEPDAVLMVFYVNDIPTNLQSLARIGGIRYHSCH